MRQIFGWKRRAIVVAAVVLIASIVTAVWVLDRHERGVELAVYTDKTHYESGESVHICIQLKNYGFSSVRLVYGSSLTMYFSIHNSDGLEVYPHPPDICPAITEVILEPGEVSSHDWIWDQANKTGEQVTLPDTFTVRAFSLSYEEHFYANATFSVST